MAKSNGRRRSPGSSSSSSPSSSSRSKFVKHHQFFQYLARLPPKRQKEVLERTTDKGIWQAFAEVCWNLLRQNVELTESEKKLLRPYARQIHEISLKRNSIAKKRHAVQVSWVYIYLGCYIYESFRKRERERESIFHPFFLLFQIKGWWLAFWLTGWNFTRFDRHSYFQKWIR